MSYPKWMRDDLAHPPLHLEDIRIPLIPMFVGHGHLQQPGPGRNAHHALQYIIYIIPNDYNLKDAVAFAYGSSLKPKVIGSAEKPSVQRTISREESDNGSLKESGMNKWILKAFDTPES